MFLKNNDDYKKLMYLNNKTTDLTEQEIDMLEQYADDINFDYKYLLPEIIMNYPSAKTELVLLRLALNSDLLTRINAVDSLCIGKMDITIEKLIFMMKNDENHLIRAYSILSYFDVLENRFYENIDDEFDEEKIYTLLYQSYIQEKNPIVKVSYFTVFYKLGEKKYLVDLINMWVEYYEESGNDLKRWILGAFKDFVYETDADWYDSNVIKIIRDFLIKYIPMENNKGLKTDMKVFLDDVQHLLNGEINMVNKIK